MGKRRSRGDGSIFQRKDGYWVASVLLPDGKRRDVYAASRAEAAAKLRQLQQQIAHHRPVGSDRLTLARYLAAWHEGLDTSDTKRTTVVRYAVDVRRWSDALGGTRLPDLTVAAVQRQLTVWRSAGLAPATVRHARAVLSSALHEAQRQRIVDVNVADLARPPRLRPVEPRAITGDEARAILAAFADHPLRQLVTVAIGTGLRQGELLGLTWKDVDLEAGTLDVRRRLYPLVGAYDIDDVKRARSRGAVALPAFVVEALRSQRQWQIEARIGAGKAWRESGRVFTRADGWYLNGPSVTHRFEKQLAAADLPVITFHQLRHATGTLLVALGVPIRVVMDVLRHANIQTTAQLYAHVIPDVQRDAANRLDDALGRG